MKQVPPKIRGAASLSRSSSTSSLASVSTSSLISQLASTLVHQRGTLALAESCTGGLIASQLTSRSGASSYFLGGVVSYANEAKRDLLGVPDKLLQTRGAVSPEVALSMARGARRQFHSAWAVSVTGIAGPSGGTPKKPVGLVYCAVVGPGVEEVRKSLFKGTRKQIQKETAKVAVQFLIHILKLTKKGENDGSTW